MVDVGSGHLVLGEDVMDKFDGCTGLGDLLASLALCRT